MRYIEGIGNMTVSFLIMGTFGTIVTLLLTGQPPFEWRHFPFIIINVLPFFGNQPFVLYRGRPVQPVAGKHPDLGWQSNVWLLFRWCLFPLSIYPRWFVEIAQWTPFYSVYYLSIKLVYDFSWANLAQAVLLNTFWITLIVGFIVFAYGKHH